MYKFHMSYVIFMLLAVVHFSHCYKYTILHIMIMYNIQILWIITVLVHCWKFIVTTKSVNTTMCITVITIAPRYYCH